MNLYSQRYKCLTYNKTNTTCNKCSEYDFTSNIYFHYTIYIPIFGVIPFDNIFHKLMSSLG